MAELIGGSGKTYRLADNLTTDYKDFSEIQDLWENTVVEDQILMELIAASNETMENHTHTPFVMDAISTSTTAMNAVASSPIAMDTFDDASISRDAVTATEMAASKFLAGRATLDPTLYTTLDGVANDLPTDDQAAMDGVSASRTAMDVVSTSSAVMDAVSASPLAYSTFFKSDYNLSSLWASDPGAKTILANSGDKTLPYNDGGYANIEVDDGTQSATPGNTAHHLMIDMNGAGVGDYVSVSYPIDLSNANTLELKDKAEGFGDRRLNYGVKVGGTSLFETDGSKGYTTRSFDISMYDGTQSVEFYHENTDYNENKNHEYYFADLKLI